MATGGIKIANEPGPTATDLPEMSIVRGFVKSDGNGIIGTFDLEGVPYHLLIDVKKSTKEFECTNAVLSYLSLEKLKMPGIWSGTIGKDDIKIVMNNGREAAIMGSLNVRRSSNRVSGAGRWRTVNATSPGRPDAANGQQDGTSASIRSIPPTPTNGQQDGTSASVISIIPTPNSVDMEQNPVKLAYERQLLESGDPIIAVLGQSGTGKSTFLNLIASEQQEVGRGLQSCTSEISVLGATVGGRRIVIIDTPGIDDTRVGVKEADILVAIARRLQAMGERRIWVTGVLFLHRISDNKFSRTANRVSNVVKSLCGKEAMTHVMLCTTMWDKVSQEEGDERFNELCEIDVWREMISQGASTSQISCVDPDAKAEAESIVSELIKNVEPVELAIQAEMIKQGKTIAETSAGMILVEHLKEAREEAREEAEREMEELREEIRKERVAVAARLAEAILANGLEVEMLKRETKNQAREQQAHGEQPGRDQGEVGLAEHLRQTVLEEGRDSVIMGQGRARELEELQRQDEKLGGAHNPYPW